MGNGAKTEKDGREAGPGKAEGGDRNPKSYPVQWRVSGKITQFAIELRPDPLGWISIAFEHFGVAFGPPKPKSENGKQEKDENKDDNREKTESVELELDYRMAGIQAGGMLGFVVKLIQLAAGLPQIPDLSVGEASTAYPAKLPDVGDADLSVTVGPISAPKFKWLNFEVTNAAASFGVGLYFLPRRLKASEPPAVPDNLFTIRVASADKPLTLVSTPWGGIAHLGFNFTPRGLTGFQGSLGIVYRVEFDLGAAKGKCEGSVAGVFTYEIGDGSGPRHQFALVLKLSGQAAVAGFIDIHLSLTAVGVWQSNLWGFSAEIDVRVKIGFFAVSVRFRFEYTLSDGGGDRRRLAAAGADETEPLNRDDWLTYWSAFAEEM